MSQKLWMVPETQAPNASRKPFPFCVPSTPTDGLAQQPLGRGGVSGLGWSCEGYNFEDGVNKQALCERE